MVALVFLLDVIWNIVLYVRVAGLDEESVVDKDYTAPVFDLDEGDVPRSQQHVATDDDEMVEVTDGQSAAEAPGTGQVTTVADVRDPPTPEETQDAPPTSEETHDAPPTDTGASGDADDASEPTTGEQEEETMDSKL